MSNKKGRETKIARTTYVIIAAVLVVTGATSLIAWGSKGFEDWNVPPYKRRAEAQKRLDKLCSERDDLDKHHRWDYDYEEKRKALTRGIGNAN